MAKKLYSLTPEHRDQLKPWADKWIANAMNTAPLTADEKSRVREAIVGLYEAANLKPPPAHRIIFVPSPIVARFAGGFAAWFWHNRGNDATRDATRDATFDATEAATRAATFAATRAATRDATEAATRAATSAATEAATYDATFAATDAATLDATFAATDAATSAATAAATEAATRAATSAATYAATNDATFAATAAATLDAMEAATSAATYAATRAATRDATEAATRDATEAATRDATFAATDAATSAATAAATRDATSAATAAATRAATRAATEAATRDATDAATDAATRAATRDATRDATEAATFAATAAATLDAMEAATDDATRDATDAATLDATRDATLAATDAATSAATFAATRAATRDATRDATDAAWYHLDLTSIVNLARNFGGKAALRCCYYAGYMWSGGSQWSAWVSYLSFFRHVAGLNLDYSKWDHYEVAALAGPRIMHSEFCIISDRPRVLTVDSDNRPHGDSGPFCKWADGFALYSWHGIRVPEWMIEQKDLITPAIIDAESNAEIRRAMTEIYGEARYVEDGGAEKIHEDEFGTLLRKEVPGDEPIVMVRVKNSTPEPDGSIKTYFLQVHPELRPMLSNGILGAPQKMTARNGVASTFGLRGEEYAPEVET